jgi:adenylate kinase family enzyme
MNERIRELALQAKFMAEEGINRQISYNAELKAFVEKFAELIVQECVDIIQRESEKAIRNNTYMGDDVPASVTQWAIKKHFGVE